MTSNGEPSIENQGSLRLNDVNFAASLAFAPKNGDSVTLIGGAGQITGDTEVNGAVLDPWSNASLRESGNVYPFQRDDSAEGLKLDFATQPQIDLDAYPPGSFKHVTITTALPVPASDVVADWRFEEGAAGQTAATRMIDSSGNGHDGTPIGAPVYSANVPFSTVPETGQSDTTSLGFDGTSQSVFVPDNHAFVLKHSLTLEALVYVTPSPNNSRQYIISRGDDLGALGPYSLTIDGTGANLTASFNITDAAKNTAAVSAPIPGVSQWIDIAGTLDDATGTMRLYINGVAVASTATSVRPTAVLDPNESPGLGIGNTPSANDQTYFHGLINEVRICDIALGPEQLFDVTRGNFVVAADADMLLNEPLSDLHDPVYDLSMFGLEASGGEAIDVTPNPMVFINIGGSDGFPPSAPSDTLILPQWGKLHQSLDSQEGYSGQWSNDGDKPITFGGMRSLQTKLEPAPQSTVYPLPSASAPAFGVSWSGDDSGGPGIADYEIFVSDNGGPFSAWLKDTTATSATWQGQLGHTYAFYSLAIDVVGQSQPAPGGPQATTQAIVGEPNANYVTAVYHDVLSRKPDPAGLAYWTDLLNSGTNRSSVAYAIAHSFEYYRTFVVELAYVRLLGRAGDDAGLDYWANQMVAGHFTDQQLEAEIAGSGELFQLAGGTEAAWVQAVYQRLLGRSASADEVSYWTRQISGVTTQATVAQEIAHSQENNALLIKQDYFHYLGRQPDDAGLAYWLRQFAAGETNEDVIAGFTGSAEYYQEHSD